MKKKKIAIVSKRKATGRLNSFIQNHSPSPGYLPLVHVTRAYAFAEILSGEALQPRQCPVFNEKLTYLFYGRPAYRAKDGNNVRLQFEWPIVFLFDPHKISSIKRVFPFDTGAFELELYNQFFAKESQKEDFELEPSLSSATKLVSAFYLDQHEYYLGRTRKNVELPDFEFEAHGIHELAQLPGAQGETSIHRPRDERSSAIEIQLGKALQFSDALLAVVLPLPYMSNKQVQEALTRWKVKELETYLTLHNLGGEAWVGQIYTIVEKLYRRLGYPK
jgi:hypothetical protein